MIELKECRIGEMNKGDEEGNEEGRGSGVNWGERGARWGAGNAGGGR